MAQRGSYAKGVAKRNEILATALDVIADQGINGASIKELAAAVHLSQAGLLYYFDSKDDLFTQILRARDLADGNRLRETIGLPTPPDTDDTNADGDAIADEQRVAWEAWGRFLNEAPDRSLTAYVELAHRNTEVPGLVELFSRMAVEAADPSSAAHDFFEERGRGFRSGFEALFRTMQDQGRLAADLDVEGLARAVQALSDGLQLQYLLDPGLDMGAIVQQFLQILLPDWTPQSHRESSATPPVQQEDAT